MVGFGALKRASGLWGSENGRTQPTRCARQTARPLTPQVAQKAATPRHTSVLSWSALASTANAADVLVVGAAKLGAA